MEQGESRRKGAVGAETERSRPAVIRWGRGHKPSQIHLLPPDSKDSKASWKNVGLYGVPICFGFGERIKWTH